MKNTIDLSSDSGLMRALSENRLGVLSTLSAGGIPQGALVGYAEMSDFSVIFGSDVTSRKSQNILMTPKASLTIDAGGNRTVQMEGSVVALDRDSSLISIHAAKHRSFAKFRDVPTNRYYVLRPTWIRYSDYACDPPKIEEWKFLDSGHREPSQP